MEATTAEEKCSRNTYIVADVALMRALERLAQWNDTDGIALQMHQYEAAQIQKLSRKRGLSVGEENQHRHQLMLLEQHIHALVDERKTLENDIKLKRAGLQASKKDIKSVKAKKKRITQFSPRLKTI